MVPGYSRLRDFGGRWGEVVVSEPARALAAPSRARIDGAFIIPSTLSLLAFQRLYMLAGCSDVVSVPRSCRRYLPDALHDHYQELIT